MNTTKMCYEINASVLRSRYARNVAWEMNELIGDYTFAIAATQRKKGDTSQKMRFIGGGRAARRKASCNAKKMLVKVKGKKQSKDQNYQRYVRTYVTPLIVIDDPG